MINYTKLLVLAYTTLSTLFGLTANAFVLEMKTSIVSPSVESYSNRHGGAHFSYQYLLPGSKSAKVIREGYSDEFSYMKIKRANWQHLNRTVQFIHSNQARVKFYIYDGKLCLCQTMLDNPHEPKCHYFLDLVHVQLIQNLLPFAAKQAQLANMFPETRSAIKRVIESGLEAYFQLGAPITVSNQSKVSFQDKTTRLCHEQQFDELGNVHILTLITPYGKNLQVSTIKFDESLLDVLVV
jgi:hypothetical protein